MEEVLEKLQKMLNNKKLLVDKVNLKFGTSFNVSSKMSDIINVIDSVCPGVTYHNGEIVITDITAININLDKYNGCDIKLLLKGEKTGELNYSEGKIKEKTEI